MTDDRVLGLIPARGGSKGIPRKNVKALAGKPLIAHSIQAGIDANVIDSVIVSTDDDKIATVAAEHGAQVPFLRPSELAADETPTEPVIEHTLDELRKRGEHYDTVILLQPTSPLRTAEHIDEAYNVYEQAPWDSLISAYPTTEIRWKKSDEGVVQINYEEASKRRQDRDPEYIINGAIYITSVDNFLETQEITYGKTAIYEMTERESIDIDTPFDLWLADQILTER